MTYSYKLEADKVTFEVVRGMVAPGNIYVPRIKVGYRGEFVCFLCKVTCKTLPGKPLKRNDWFTSTSLKADASDERIELAKLINEIAPTQCFETIKDSVKNAVSLCLH